MTQHDRLGGVTPGAMQREQTSVALSGGLGLSARVGRATLFAEGRFTRFPSGYNVRGAMVPVILGVRF